MMSRLVPTLILFAVAAEWSAAADSYHIVLTGSGGEPQYRTEFIDWGRRLSNALVTHADAQPDKVSWLAERVNGQPADAGDINRETIESLLKTVGEQATEKDDVYIYLIGHGSAYSRESKFQIPGPDITAEDFAEYLADFKARRIVILDATSASAGFINVLSGPNRVICTATKSAGEFNATQFMEHFIHALEDGSADRNHDERVSFDEVCTQAAELTASWYTSEGLIATEHAILDDNGDGLGTRLFNPDMETEVTDKFDGKLASKVYLKDYSFPDSVPRELVDAYLAALDEIESWKEKKADMEHDPYYAGLEERLLSAARINRDIHRHLPPDNNDS